MDERIVKDPDILGGKPTIRGTRISVQIVMEWIESGGTPEMIVKLFPYLKIEDIEQAIEYAKAGHSLHP